MNRSVSAALLGSSDGYFTGLGLALGLVAGLTSGGLVRAALTTAVAGTVSMALGELVSDSENGLREVVAMGVSWLTMCLLPVLTALAGLGWWLIPSELVVLGAGMAWARSGRFTWRNLVLVYGVMAGVAVPTVVTAVVL